ncbi:tetratricopeptide repeat protein [Protofrankia symbiont of Coriaria ruscifolia]|uniref:Thioredoxin domain-containing protein n=1 Tax=Candidatus Protofrankia californiensis TaxID=1839754 RepID=A0A1C3PEJ8_9ACTN|nr:tetratricopeptide repeat protein [Protofrankia symbiont of Coriaria ruscifolia]SBW28241.1 thioredoxin domain-containing protein [Candidatus Protofrankia californiensis]
MPPGPRSSGPVPPRSRNATPGDPRLSNELAGLRFAGAVPLDPKPAPTRPSTGAVGARAAQSDKGSPAQPVVVDVSEATFATEVLQRSMQTPVVVDFWAEWCGPCKQLSPILERLAETDGGRWTLAKIDVDANPQLAQAAGVQGIPAVKAIIGGRIIGEFTGALPEREVRAWLDQLLALVDEASAGLPGGPDPAVSDPHHTAAEDALARGDLDAAAAAYRARLAETPGDSDAALGLSRVELFQRVATIDATALRTRLSADPDNVEAAIMLADVLVAKGEVETGLARLVSVVRRTSGDERERVRAHLVGLFQALGDAEPAVGPARRALAAALF